MRNGTPVRYVPKRGKTRTATVTQVTGTGDSGFKVVSLQYRTGKGFTVEEDVPHKTDASGRGYWVLD